MMAYISEFTGDLNKAKSVIDNIVSTAKKNNYQHGITGILFYQKGSFFQVIEVKEPELRKLMDNIQSDKRHKNITVLFDENVNSRGFDEWNMDSFNLDESDKLDLDEVLKIRDALQENIIPRADNLVEMYESFLKDKVFSSQ